MAQAKLAAAVTHAKNDSHSFVAVFGSGYAVPAENASSLTPSDPRNAAFGFSGIANVHMNQGSDYRVGRHLDSQYRENGPNQDGAVLFFLPDKTVQGFFCKFASQDIETDAFGNPTHTGVPERDNPALRNKLHKIPEHIWRDMIDINLSGVWKSVKAAVPHILAGGRGGSIC